MPKTPAQKKAQAAYMGKFSRISVRVSPEVHEMVKTHAATQGESVNDFVLRAVNEAIDRDKSPEAAGSPAQAFDGWGVYLTPETLQAAQEAAKAVGEEVPAFVQRAIKSQSRRDKVARRFGLEADPDEE